MKKLGSNLRAFATARLIFFVIISVLIAGSFTATALMQSSDARQAKANGKVSQAQNQQRSNPTADFWQEVFETPAAVHAGQQEPLQARRFRSFTLNRGAMQRADAFRDDEIVLGRDLCKLLKTRTEFW